MTKDISFLVSIHISQNQIDPPFNPLWAAASPSGVLMVIFGISLEGFTDCIKQRFPHADVLFNHAPHPALVQIGEFLNGERQTFTTPLDLTGTTSFQRKVYQAVMEIPYGDTRTYGQVAHLIGKPGAARAVGAANGANPLPILIPCHRLVGADSSMRGYGGAGGTETKMYLLELEKRHATP